METTGLLKGIQQEARQLTAEMPFETYLEKVKQDRKLARLSHALVYDMIVESGLKRDRAGVPRYELFRDDLFGVDEAIAQVVEYFAAAARRHETRKRILLLVGPPGCGKSTLVNAIKQGLEEYSRADRGAVWAIKGCPVYEDPLHLLPRHVRHELRGLHIEGELCPYCRWLVRNAYRGDVARVPVQRFTFSAAEGVGIGTFVATDPGSENLARLVGDVDLTQLRGSTDRAAARQAYRLDGELNAANRGLADLIEVFKMDERFLSVLLTVSQEQMIKLGGRGTMYADEAIVAHSNLAEYDSLVADPRAAALLDRLVVVPMGYALSVRDEVRIYEKMIGQAGLRGVKISPLALPTAATFAILTRISPQSGWSLQRKLHYYDSRFVADVRPQEIAQLRAASPRDGMSGFSPRYVMNQVSRALSRKNTCLTGPVTLDILWEGLSQRAGFDDGQRQAAADLIATARREYDDMVRRTIRRVLVPDYRRAAQKLARDVLRELEGWSAGSAQDLSKLRDLENALGVGPYLRQEFRESLLARLRETGRSDPGLYRADGRLEEGIDRLLLPRWEDAARSLGGFLEEPKSKGLAKLRKQLVAEHDFPEECADDLVAYAVSLAGPELERRGILRWR